MVWLFFPIGVPIGLQPVDSSISTNSIRAYDSHTAQSIENLETRKFLLNIQEVCILKIPLKTRPSGLSDRSPDSGLKEFRNTPARYAKYFQYGRSCKILQAIRPGKLVVKTESPGHQPNVPLLDGARCCGLFSSFHKDPTVTAIFLS